jgi:hypothetical protein
MPQCGPCRTRCDCVSLRFRAICRTFGKQVVGILRSGRPGALRLHTTAIKHGLPRFFYDAQHVGNLAELRRIGKPTPIPPEYLLTYSKRPTVQMGGL